MGALDDAIDVIEHVVGELDPQRLDGQQAVRLVELFTRCARYAEAGRVLAARRVAETKAWSAQGHRSAEEWLAAKTKTSPATSAAVLKAATQLVDQHELEQSFRAGRLSTEQVVEISNAVQVDPDAEHRLVAEAEQGSLRRTRKSCHAVRAAAATDPVGDRAKIHASRYFRHWTSSDGAFEGRFRLTADQGAVVLAAIDTERQEVFAEARAHKVYESSEAMQADAFVDMARTTLEAAADPSPTISRSGGSGDPERTSSRNDRPWSSDPFSAEGDSHEPQAPPLFSSPNDSNQPDPSSPFRSQLDGERPMPTAPTPTGPGVTTGGAGSKTATDTSGPDNPPSDPDDPPPSHPNRRSRACPTCGQQPRPARPPAVINVRVDHAALVRGHTIAGEVCEIEGIGPVPVETVEAAASDAILNALLIKDGKVVKTVAAGRTISADLRRKLRERDLTCAVPGCDTRRHLQVHHLKRYADGGPTTEPNTVRVCTWHHDQLTYGYAELTGSPGHWIWRLTVSAETGGGQC